MDNKHIVSANVGERADLVFAILKRPLFVLVEREIELLRDSQAVIPRAPDRKQAQFAIHQHAVVQNFPRRSFASERGGRVDREQSWAREIGICRGFV